MVDGAKRWHPVSTVAGLISIKGGYNSKPEVANTIEYEFGGVVSVFVALDKNAAWFLKGVGGTGTTKGSLQSVQVHNLLRGWFQDGLAHTAVADTQSNSESQEPEDDPPKDEIDPMDALDDPADTTPQIMNADKQIGRCYATKQEVKQRATDQQRAAAVLVREFLVSLFSTAYWYAGLIFIYVHSFGSSMA